MRWRVGLLLGYVLLVAISLPSESIYQRDEVFYADAVRTMLAQGDLLVPEYDGEPRLEVAVAYQDRAVAFEPIAKPRPQQRPAAAARVVRGSRPPAADHPWKRYPAVEKPAAERGRLWK